MLAALYPKAATAKGPKRQGNGAQGERPCPKRTKGPRPARRQPPPACFPCSGESDPGRCLFPAGAGRQSPKRTDAAAVGRAALGAATPAKTAATSPAAHVALTQAVHHPVPRAVRTRPRAGLGLPGLKSHHHAYPSGMLDRGPEIVAYALNEMSILSLAMSYFGDFFRFRNLIAVESANTP